MTKAPTEAEAIAAGSDDTRADDMRAPTLLDPLVTAALARWHRHLEECDGSWPDKPWSDPLVGGVRILPYRGLRPRGAG